MKLFDREAERFTQIVKEKGRLSKEAREQHTVCLAIEVIKDLQTNLVMDGNGHVARLHNMELFERIMLFK